MIEKFDTNFFAETGHQHPGSWIIVGLFIHQNSPSPRRIYFLFNEGQYATFDHSCGSDIFFPDL